MCVCVCEELKKSINREKQNISKHPQMASKSILSIQNIALK